MRQHGFDSEAGPVAAKAPIVATEIGDNDCSAATIISVMSWLDSRGQSYLAFTWTVTNLDFALVTDYSGTPAIPYGQGYHDHLAALAHLPPATVPAPQGPMVNYPAGMNLVGTTTGTVLTGAAGSLYTYQQYDSAYEVQQAGSPLCSPRGYWAYFPMSTTVRLSLSFVQSVGLPLPAGHWIMVGVHFRPR